MFVNQVNLVGRLGGDPEIYRSEGKKSCARFNLAVNQSYKNSKSVWVDETEWFTVVCYEALVDSIKDKNLQKGDEISVDGRLKNKSWTNPNDKIQYRTIDIIAREIELLTKKKAVEEPSAVNKKKYVSSGKSFR